VLTSASHADRERCWFAQQINIGNAATRENGETLKLILGEMRTLVKLARTVKASKIAGAMARTRGDKSDEDEGDPDLRFGLYVSSD